jgi:hypothetical protein
MARDNMARPRTLLFAGIGLLVLAAICVLTVRLTYGERSAYIHVRWAPNVDDAARERAERAHALTAVEFKEQRTWLYLLTDVSTDNIRQLVADPAVEDTHYINRRRASVTWSAERGEFSTNRPRWIADALEFATRIATLAAGVAILASAYYWWQARRRPVAVAAD